MADDSQHLEPQPFLPVTIKDSDKPEFIVCLLTCIIVPGIVVALVLLDDNPDVGFLIVIIIAFGLGLVCFLTIARSRPMCKISIHVDTNKLSIEYYGVPHLDSTTLEVVYGNEMLLNIAWHDVKAARVFKEIYWWGRYRGESLPWPGTAIAIVSTSETHVLHTWKTPLHTHATRKLVRTVEDACNAIGKEFHREKKAKWLKRGISSVRPMCETIVTS